MSSTDIKLRRFSHHDNAFGFLRLVLALLVIVAHTPELADGDRHRELLTMMFGTISFGEFAVDGFFVISGYLITGSFLSSRTLRSYLKKRVARIYPAFLVAYMLSALVVGPASGGVLPTDLSSISRLFFEAGFLQQPLVQHAFASAPYPLVNGAMWTIAYEFRCYLLVMLLGMTGLLRRRWVIVALTLAAALASLMLPLHPYAPSVGRSMDAVLVHPGIRDMLIGNTRQLFRLVSIFLIGGCFYLYREQLKFPVLGVTFAVVALSFGLLFSRSAELCVALFGGYLLIAIARWGGHTLLARINNEEDVSYGVYLSGWPVGMLLFWWSPRLPHVAAMAATFILCWLYGFLSWRLIERPVMQYVRYRSTSIATIAPSGSGSEVV